LRLNEAELVRWGSSIGASTIPPVFIGLSGALGAGKSVLARAIGVGAGVSATMPSPSYTLLQRYEGSERRRVVHLDLYRIESPQEVHELGWAQLGDAEEIVLVEWPERAGEFLPSDHWVINLEVPDGRPLLRDIAVRRVGSPPDLPGFPMSASDSP
jgi:tRNA threonylcarbamoyl adenosine modification protein YjeE